MLHKIGEVVGMLVSPIYFNESIDNKSKADKFSFLLNILFLAHGQKAVQR
jgi:hypothetical protein